MVEEWKRFDGKLYELKTVKSTRKLVEARKKAYRKEGQRTRIIRVMFASSPYAKPKKMYALYARKRGR